MRAFALPLLAVATLQGCNGCGSDQAIVPDPVGTDDPGDPHDVGSWLSMGVMPDGRPAVAYYDRTSDALGFAIGTVSETGVKWATEEVDSYPDENGLNPGDAGKYASMAITSDGTVWVVYQDSSNTYLKYARRDTAGAWTTGVADVGGGSSSDAGYWASIALDPSENPVASHHDANQGTLRVTRWNGTSFTGAVAYEGTDYVPTDTASESATGNAGEYSSIAIRSDGTEYIAFYDRAWGALRVAIGGASGYTVDLVDDSADVGQWPDVAFEGSNVKIAYQDVTNQDLLLATGGPGSWSSELVDSGDHVGADAAIYNDGIVYFDGANNDMKLARKSGDTWVLDTVNGTGAVGYHNETVEIGGVRYVACYDYTTRGIWFSALP